MKTCTKCGISKEENCFYKRKGYGTQNTCAICWKKLFYEPKKEIYQENDRKRSSSPERRYTVLRKKCKEYDLELDISLDNYKKLITQECEYCADKLGDNISGIGLDRLDPTQGYIIANVVPCCTFCNIIKWDLLTHDEMKKVAALLIEERKDQAPVNVYELHKSRGISNHPNKVGAGGRIKNRPIDMI